MISYTSGTTNEKPKGAMITHLNMYAGYAKHEFLGFSYFEDDVYLSYVPLSHIYEQLMVSSSLMFGFMIGFHRPLHLAQGN